MDGAQQVRLGQGHEPHRPAALNPYRRDEYAEDVKAALQRAGVPAGSEVMLVGHGYGGYAAMHLAADRTFNRAGVDPDGRYSVEVTDAVSFAAATNHYLPRVPPGTTTLVVASAEDVPAAIESLPDAPESLWAGVGGEPRNHHSVLFDSSLWSVAVGAGHSPGHYDNWLIDGHFDPETEAIISGIGERYGGPGDAIIEKVPDR